MTHSAYTRETFAAFRDHNRPDRWEAYSAYGSDAEPEFKRLRRKILWRGSPRLILIRPNEETWDIRFITKYPRRSTLRINLAVLAALAAYALAVVLLVSP